MISLTADVTNLNRDLATYAQLARMSLQDAVLKQGSKITIGAKGVEGWSQRLKRLMPAKGAITAARLGALQAGGGILIRPSAYRSAERQLGKRKGAYSDLVTRKIMRMTKGGAVAATAAGGLNLQALAVKKELALRERARGFSAYGAMMRGGGRSLAAMAATIPSGVQTARRRATFRGRYRQALSSADIYITDRGASAGMGLVFGTPDTTLGESLTQSRQQAALQGALRATHADMMSYIQRKLREAKGKAGLT